MIKEGQRLKINAMGIMNDPKYFPHPEKFNPENFMNNTKENRSRNIFIPFGTGPRDCIAYRFALLEMKMCLAHVVPRFNFFACERTKSEFEIDNNNVLGGIKGGFWVGCRRRTVHESE